MVVRRDQLSMDVKAIFFLFSISFVNGQNGTENEKTDCTAFLIGKDVQFEYRFPSYESYWLTHQTDVNWRPKVQWSHVKDVSDPDNGYTWRLHFCGTNDDGEPVICLESLLKKWDRYFLHGREMKYAATEDALLEDIKFHYKVQCRDCKHSNNCEIVQTAGDCKLYVNYKIFRGYQVYCGNVTVDEDDPPDSSRHRWSIRYVGALNGDEISTIDEISNCSPGGQTLTKSVEFEEGTINTNSESHSHSIESGFEAIPGFKFFAELSGRIRFSQKNEWSKASQTSIQTRKRSTISVPVLPGQICTVWQSILHFGNLEMKSAANYTTISCPADLDEATIAYDRDKVIQRIENCSPGQGSRRGSTVHFKQGLVNKDVNWHLNYVPLPVDPKVISAIESAIKISPNVTRKEEWSDLDLSDQLIQFQRSVEYSGADGLEIPPGKSLIIYQLVLNYGKYTAYSGRLWHELEDCQESRAAGAVAAQSGGNGPSTRQLSIWIAIGVIGIILLLVLLVLLWRFRDKLACCRARSHYEMSLDPLKSDISTSQQALDTSRGSSFSFSPENRTNSIASMDQPPSYHTFFAESSK